MASTATSHLEVYKLLLGQIMAFVVELADLGASYWMKVQQADHLKAVVTC